MKDTRSLIRKEIEELPNKGLISYETYCATPMNTYERNYITQFLDDEALLKLSCKCLEQVSCLQEPTTYEETIIHKLFPELLTRFKKKIESFQL